MTDPTPGSRWLLPVRFSHSTPWQDRTILTVMPYGGNSSVVIPVEDPTSLIPADRITELEAEVTRLQAHVDRFEGLYDAARGDVVEAEMKAERLRIVGALAGALMTALRTHGYPVSDAHLGNAGEIMSREARDLHLAAVNLRQALDAEGDGQ